VAVTPFRAEGFGCLGQLASSLAYGLAAIVTDGRLRWPWRVAPMVLAVAAEGDRSARRCQPVTADTWRVAEDNAGFRTVTYLVRREEALTTISGMGWNGVPEDAMCRAARSLRSHPPSFFTS
jgi:hypothetical protein